jgi:hypothetical protein
MRRIRVITGTFILTFTAFASPSMAFAAEGEKPITTPSAQNDETDIQIEERKIKLEEEKNALEARKIQLEERKIRLQNSKPNPEEVLTLPPENNSKQPPSLKVTNHKSYMIGPEIELAVLQRHTSEYIFGIGFGVGAEALIELNKDWASQADLLYQIETGDDSKQETFIRLQLLAGFRAHEALRINAGVQIQYELSYKYTGPLPGGFAAGGSNNYFTSPFSKKNLMPTIGISYEIPVTEQKIQLEFDYSFDIWTEGTGTTYLKKHNYNLKAALLF